MVRRSTWIILGVFVLVLAAFLIYRQVSQNQPEESPADAVSEILEQPPAQKLFGIPPDDYVVGLSVEDENEGIVEINRASEEANWEFLEANDAADQETIDRAINQIISLEIDETLDGKIDLSLVGLEEPSHTLQLFISNGGIFSLYIGDVTITDTSYYVRLPSDHPMVVNKYPLDTVISWLSDPPIQEIPTSTPEE